MKFEHPDYPGNFSIRLVEVYYDHGEENSWCEPHLAQVEDLDVPEGASQEEIQNAFAKEFLLVQGLMAKALEKPILLESDFPDPD